MSLGCGRAPTQARITKIGQHLRAFRRLETSGGIHRKESGPILGDEDDGGTEESEERAHKVYRTVTPRTASS